MVRDGGEGVTGPEVMKGSLKAGVLRHDNSRPHTAIRGCRRYPGLVITTLLVMLSAVNADPLQVHVSGGLLANAEYHRAANRDSAVLILHGFLATHHFPTVQRLADDLHDAGYAVLTPTLTLGIDNRTTSLPCDALHLHNMDQTINELAWWIDWLAAEGYQRIDLIGHSAGSLQILILSQQHLHPAVRQMILTSLVSLERLPGVPPKGESREIAEQRLARGDHAIAKYDVSFCHGNFAAPPEVYLSYTRWSKQWIAEALRSTSIPATVIMGGDDNRFTGTDWMPMLQQAAPRLVVLEGASHFFEGEGEFALLDSILARLEQPQVVTSDGR